MGTTQSSFCIFDFFSDLISTSSEWVNLGGKSIQLISLCVLKCTDKCMWAKAWVERKQRHSCHNPNQGTSIRCIYVGLDKALCNCRDLRGYIFWRYFSEQTAYTSLLERSKQQASESHTHSHSTPKFIYPGAQKAQPYISQIPALLKGKIPQKCTILCRLEILICEPFQPHQLGYISVLQVHTADQALGLPRGKPPKNRGTPWGRAPTLSSMLEGYMATGALAN